MGVDYKGLLKGNIGVVELARTMALVYGGDQYSFRFGNDSIIDFGFGLGKGIESGHFVISFSEEFSDEVKAMRPWDRKGHRVNRMMHVFNDDNCRNDYAHVTDETMTYVSLGHFGECKEIIDALVARFGGFVCDETNDLGFVTLSPEDHAVAAARIQARFDAIAATEAKYRTDKE
jgi:hypothetical protein